MTLVLAVIVARWVGDFATLSIQTQLVFVLFVVITLIIVILPSVLLLLLFNEFVG